ncbi:MAG TPA: efflux RND transporter permease subunit, partial [Planctomycetaceae bacterium]|nr:efflux RND transporter permease subunit [Planctomycetaceae bacterium]
MSCVLRLQTLTLLVALGTLAATVYLYFVVPKGFFPVQDTGVIMGISEAPQDISFEAMAQRQLALNRAILADPAVESLSSFIGIDGTNTTINSGRIQINLKPLAERRLSASDVIRRLQPRLADVTGITLFMQPVQDLTVETRISRTQYQYSLEDPDAKELSEWASRFVSKLQSLPQLHDVASDQQNDGLQAKVIIDRDTASRLGVTPQMIDDALYDAFGQRQISIMFTQLNQYRLVLEVKPNFKNEPRDLQEIYLRPAGGGPVPLGSFTRIEEKAAPLVVSHQGQFPVVTVSFNLAPGVSLGEAVEAIASAKRQLGVPSSIAAGFQGTAEAFQASLKNTPLLILAALVTVYIVLGVLYESYIHPVTILSTLPSAGVGALV